MSTNANVDWLINRTRLLEEEILEVVKKLVDEYEKDTGLTPVTIDFEMTQYESVSSDRFINEIIGVDVGVAI